jgi:hypothetical protein
MTYPIPRKLADEILDLLRRRQEESKGNVQDQDLKDAAALASTEAKEGRLSLGRGDLAGRVKSWLESSGFALEMRVARILLAATGERAMQGEHYLDPDNDEIRETDMALYVPVNMTRKDFGIIIVIECKDARDKPWVMLCSRRSAAPLKASVAQRPATELGAKVLHKLATEDWGVDDTLESSSLFKLPEVLGYRLMQSHQSRQQDVAYGALMSLTAASWGLLNTIEHRMEQAAVLAWPVLVVGGSLFQATLDENTGEMAIKQVEEATLAWRNPRRPRMLGQHSFVKVVTERGLSAFVTQLWGDIHEFLPIATRVLWG